MDFPLLPPAESPKEQQTQEDIDPLWEQTKREMYEPQGSRSSRSSRTRRGGGGINDSSAVKYDADKVEELKRKLIKELKHAANIRNLQPDESIILTVTGKGYQPPAPAVVVIENKAKGPDDPDMEMLMLINQMEISQRSGSSAPPTVLTIRVKKSDVDAFSKGELNFEQFRQKAQIFTY